VLAARPELAHRMTVWYPIPGQQATLERLAADITLDRQALLDLMTVLDVPVRRYKVGVAWAAEKAARLKLNGSLLSRSPLSNLEEPEMLRLRSRPACSRNSGSKRWRSSLGLGQLLPDEPGSSFAVVCFGRLTEPVEQANDAVAQPAAVADLIAGRLRDRRLLASVALPAVLSP
jgi:hypothetical protein